MLNNWIDKHFYRALDWVMKTNEFIVDTSLVGVVMNGLSHLYDVRDEAHFGVCLIRGLGANLPDAKRETFVKEVGISSAPKKILLKSVQC